MKDKLQAAATGKFTTLACGEEHTTTIFDEECSALPQSRQKSEGGPFGAY